MAVMDLVVPCDCGSRFSFSYEPAGQSLPHGAELHCPSCGKDGVPLANRVLGENLRKQAKEQEARRAAFRPKRPLRKLDPDSQPLETDPLLALQRDPFAKVKIREAKVEINTDPKKSPLKAGVLLAAAIGAAIWTAALYFTGR